MGLSPRSMTAHEEKTDCVTTLIESSASVDIGSECDRQGGHEGTSDCVSAFPKTGADANHAGEEGSTPLLSMAAQEEKSDFDTALIEVAVNVDISSEGEGQGEHERKSACVSALFKTVADANLVAEKGPTPLRVVAAVDRIDEVSTLLERLRGEADNSVNQADDEDWTPLHVAVEQGKTDCVSMLLKTTVEVNAPNMYGKTSLFLAAERGELGCVTALLAASADACQVDDNGQSPLGTAACRGKCACLIALLKGTACVNLTDSDGRTPIALAARMGKTDCVKALMRAKADVRIADCDGETPLSSASDKEKFDCIFALRKPNSSLVAYTDNDGDIISFAIDGRNLIKYVNGRRKVGSEDNSGVITRLRYERGQPADVRDQHLWGSRDVPLDVVTKLKEMADSLGVPNNLPHQVKYPKLGEVWVITEDAGILERECKDSFMGWPCGPDGARVAKLGLRGPVVQLDHRDNTVKLGGSANCWVPVWALKLKENGKPRKKGEEDETPGKGGKGKEKGGGKGKSKGGGINARGPEFGDSSSSSSSESPRNGKGHERGRGKGQEKGYSNGQEKGYGKGQEKGYSKGQEKGYSKGQERGYGKGQEKGYGKGQEKGYGERGPLGESLSPHHLEGTWAEERQGQEIHVFADRGSTRAAFSSQRTGKTWNVVIATMEHRGESVLVCGPFKLERASWAQGEVSRVEWVGMAPGSSGGGKHGHKGERGLAPQRIWTRVDDRLCV